MEVSKRVKQSRTTAEDTEEIVMANGWSEQASEQVDEVQTEPAGTELVDAVVSLTDLPEPQVKNELDGILEKAGCQAENLTLDQLRAAMLVYLEQIQMEMEAQGFEASE